MVLFNLYYHFIYLFIYLLVIRMFREGLSSFITTKPLNSSPELRKSCLNKLKGLDMLERALNSAVYSHRVRGVYIMAFSLP